MCDGIGIEMRSLVKSTSRVCEALGVTLLDLWRAARERTRDAVAIIVERERRVWIETSDTVARKELLSLANELRSAVAGRVFLSLYDLLDAVEPILERWRQVIDLEVLYLSDAVTTAIVLIKPRRPGSSQQREAGMR